MKINPYTYNNIGMMARYKGVTAYDLSKNTGISMSHAYRILGSETEDIKISTLIKISEFLNVPCFELFPALRG